MSFRTMITSILAVCWGSPAAAQRDNVVIQPIGLFAEGDATEFARSFSVWLGDDIGRFNIRLKAVDSTAESRVGSTLENEIVAEAEKRAKRLLKQLDKACELSKEQQEKLLTAAKADASALQRDIKRWLATTDAARANDKAIQWNAASLAELEKKMKARIYGEKSIYVKIFSKVISEEQKLKIQRSHLRWYTIQYKRLNAEQRERLLEMLTEASKEVPLGLSRTNYCTAVGVKLPPAELVKLVGPKLAPAVQYGAELIKP